MATNLECPVDFISVNENKVRLTALSVFLLSIFYTVTSYWIIVAFLLVDFSLRGFNFGKYSLLNKLSDLEVKIFSISNKPTDLAPKRFAAKIGLVFNAAILILNVAGQIVVSKYLAGVIIAFACLESVLNFCAGCYVYTFYRRLFKPVQQTVS